MKYLYKLFKKISDNTIGNKGDSVISLTVDAYRLNLNFTEISEFEQDILLDNPLDTQRDYYSNYLEFEPNIREVYRDDYAIQKYKPTNGITLQNLVDNADVVEEMRSSNSFKATVGKELERKQCSFEQ